MFNEELLYEMAIFIYLGNCMQVSMNRTQVIEKDDSHVQTKLVSFSHMFI